MPDIFIHSYRFTENAHLMEAAPSCLAAEELARAERFKVEPARQDFLISHCLLRQTLSRYLQTDAGSIRYRYGEHGKPHLHSPAHNDLNFSLSHSGDRLLIAICHGSEIGVDIEKIQEQSNPLQLANHFMSREEAQRLARLTDPVAQRALFFSLWTRKEAYIKALGKGFFHALDKTAMQEVTCGRYMPISEEHCDYRVIDLDIADDYKAAVAVRMDSGSLANAIEIKLLEK